MSSIWAVLIAAGVPSAVFGLLIRRMEKKLDKRAEAQEEKEAARIKNEALLIKMVYASVSLSEATAEAVARIPDAHCNGDMHAALAMVKQVKQEYRDFTAEQTLKSLN